MLIAAERQLTINNSLSRWIARRRVTARGTRCSRVRARLSQKSMARFVTAFRGWDMFLRWDSTSFISRRFIRSVALSAKERTTALNHHRTILEAHGQLAPMKAAT